jgi:hypothetical protein
LDVTNAAARVALFRTDGPWRGTSRGFVPWQTTVVAKTLFFGTVFGNVPDCGMKHDTKLKMDERKSVRLPHLKQPFLEN